MKTYRSNSIDIGRLTLGGGAPIRIQSMTNTDTNDIQATVDQSMRLFDEGCEMVRITAPSVREAQALYDIKTRLHQKAYTLPLIADIHYQAKAAELAATIVEKVRINPGNYIGAHESGDQAAIISERIAPLIERCRQYQTTLRIGVNHGSLSQRILNQYGNTPQGMCASAMEFIEILRAMNFDRLVLSMKSSHLATMVQATRLLVEQLQERGLSYPIHLGVTEAGDGEDGRIKSAIGIGSLILDGIGDTLRVSLTEDPEREIPVAKAILQACGKAYYKAEYVSCPSCGRTLYNIQKALAEVKSHTQHLIGIKIGVMGCIVNGPGEMADADYGYVGAGQGKVRLYRKKDIVHMAVEESEAIHKLIEMIREDGRWIDQP